MDDPAVDGPAMDGPAMDGPAMDGPAVDGPAVDGPAVDGRVVLLVTSPRVAPGLLSWAAWRRLVTADQVLGAQLDPAWQEALLEAGVTPQDLGDLPVAQRAGRLLEHAEPGNMAVWLGSSDGDPGLTDALAGHLSRRAVAGRPPEVELITGSHDVPGARLVDLVAVMDQLRGAGGCPWDAQQTHHSLLPYLLEETHEVIEAVERGDPAHLAEELGDLLLQVVFHARIAQEDQLAGFDVDDVAAGIVAKLVNRHPHVFADVQVDDAAQVSHNWEEIKAKEKRREGLFDGIPPTLPALARAQKMFDRLSRVPDPVGPEPAGARLRAAAGGDRVVEGLLDAVLLASSRGVDAESALRLTLSRLVEHQDGRAAGPTV